MSNSSTAPPAPTASACPASSSRTRRSGCSGRSGPTTGAWAPSRRSAPGSRWRRPSRSFEPVTVGVNNDQYENARNLLPAPVRVVEISSNDAWMRDCGPTFVVNDKGDVRLVDWDFNAWGGLYDGLYFPWDKDQMVPLKIAELEGVDRYKAHLVMEGGSIHVDGEGTVITTEECLLSPGRNPDLTPRADRGAPARLPERREGHLAGQGHRPRRDQRPRRRRRLLRAARRRAGRDHRGRGRLALRAPAGQPAAPAGGHRREGPRARGAHRADAGDHGDHRGRGLGRRLRRGQHPAGRRRQDRRVLPQLPHRQRRRDHADLRRPQRRRRARHRRGASSPTARSSPCPAARSCSAAATCTASRSSSRAADAANRARTATAAGPSRASAAVAVFSLGLAPRTGAPGHHLDGGAPPATSSLPHGSQSVSSR